MTERRTYMRTVLIETRCEKCDGRLKPGYIVLASNPPQYPHDCVDCGLVVNLKVQAKRLVYEPILEPAEPAT